MAAKKKKGSKGQEKETDLEEAERVAYEASKKRRKLAISDSEDEEREDIPIVQLVKVILYDFHLIRLNSFGLWYLFFTTYCYFRKEDQIEAH